MRSGFIKEHCLKCGGNVYLESDYYGWYEQCLQCGCIYDLESPLKVEERVNTGDKRVPAIKVPLTV